ncbi:hypothetical protein [Promicromonospora iranensis]|uniref:Uncharacterized protein n=1 Tax=Promicromonospora iranensis TaxID=1105144 RepID=A0ABU2CGP3_9MICO|nr:hypothetical protein [Promicromonospora iranensis]MDR7380502.1 hypothetical protein [Promicromonospora iranensis]
MALAALFAAFVIRIRRRPDFGIRRVRADPSARRRAAAPVGRRGARARPARRRRHGHASWDLAARFQDADGAMGWDYLLLTATRA